MSWESWESWDVGAVERALPQIHTNPLSLARLPAKSPEQLI
jgi:hypothetical protein